MGTDIHGYWEVRMKDGKWVAFKDIGDGFRDYTFFGILAGVRRPEPWKDLSEPWERGMPSNPSEAWANYVESWGPDLHSRTYLTYDEAKTAKKMRIHLMESYSRSSQTDHDWETELTEDFFVIPGPDFHIESLYMGMVYSEDEAYIVPQELPWQLSLKETVDPTKPFEECIRLVIGFDS